MIFCPHCRKRAEYVEVQEHFNKKGELSLVVTRCYCKACDTRFYVSGAIWFKS